ncbi:MAG: HAD family hydrolase [Gemmatimonadetes bacterium]|nr:HAD family hydrolase [Gemmatimonadota bacterium]
MKRLVLFDIDGTLVSGGPAKEAFHCALLEVFGTAGPIQEWEFSGKTDPQIARELLTEAGIEGDRIDSGFPHLWARYLAELEARLPSLPPRTLPGVVALLIQLDSAEGTALGLVTGNVAEGARLKLAAAGLGSWFAVGAYGSDHESRDELPGIALRRAKDRWGVHFPARDVVVIGDTPRDVDCGRRHGARTVAVATGRFSPEVLEKSGPDVVLRDLGDTGRALEAILS